MTDNRETWLADLVEGRLDVAKLPADQVVDWLNGPGLRAQLEAVCEVGEWQSRLMLSRFRPAVLSTLLRVTTHEEASPETVRRACSDLLKLHPGGKQTREQDPAPPRRLAAGLLEQDDFAKPQAAEEEDEMV